MTKGLHGFPRLRASKAPHNLVSPWLPATQGFQAPPKLRTSKAPRNLRPSGLPARLKAAKLSQNSGSSRPAQNPRPSGLHTAQGLQGFLRLQFSTPPPANRVSKTPTSSRSTSCPKKLEVEWSGSVWLLAHVISLTCLTRAALVIDQAQPTHTMRSTLRGARWRRSVYQGAGRK